MFSLLSILFSQFLAANPLDILVLTEDVTTEFIINAFFSVDSFFFVGGLLLTFLWWVAATLIANSNCDYIMVAPLPVRGQNEVSFFRFKNFNRNPKQTNSPKAWAMFYVHRFLRCGLIKNKVHFYILRLSPPYFMMVLFFTFVFKQFYRNSPVNITLENQSDSCR